MNESPGSGRRRILMLAVALGTATATAGVAALLTSVSQRKQEARNPYIRLVDVDEGTTDSSRWGVNWSREYDDYRRTAETTRTRFGGSEALPEEKATAQPWLTRMFAGYAFALDYRERRGHAYMLVDQETTKRVTERPQTGACLHCHASVIPTYRRLGAGDLMRGFEGLGKLPYAEAHAEVVKTGSSHPLPATAPGGAQTNAHSDGAHPVGCVDCHDPGSMALRVTRPAFIRAIQALAAGQADVPALPSIDRWRHGNRQQPYDPNVDASRQELRSFVCGQCHVEYYCGPKMTLFFPWDRGLSVEQIEARYDSTSFADGHRFYDWKHAETGAEVLKAQHPEFELWNQGVHARSGVSCADCHMPYKREGATKVSDHWVRSPLLQMSRACQTCHPFPEAELKARVDVIQGRTHGLQERAAAAMVAMLDAIKAAQGRGVPDEKLAPARQLQRSAQWRLDFIAAENSMGFHAAQESARILAEAIDFARQAQLAASAL